MQEALDDDYLEDEYSTYVDDLEEPTAPFVPVFADSSPVKDSNIDDKPYGYETINRRIKAILSNPHHLAINGHKLY